MEYIIWINVLSNLRSSVIYIPILQWAKTRNSKNNFIIMTSLISWFSISNVSYALEKTLKLIFQLPSKNLKPLPRLLHTTAGDKGINFLSHHVYALAEVVFRQFNCLLWLVYCITFTFVCSNVPIAFCHQFFCVFPYNWPLCAYFPACLPNIVAVWLWFTLLYDFL